MSSTSTALRLALVAAAAVGLASCQSQTTDEPDNPRGAAAVDAQRLVDADREPGSWMSHGRTYAEERFSPLDQVTAANVAELGLAWFADLDTNRGQEATPIVVDGVIYISTAWSKVKAYDAGTGEPLWDFDPEVPGEWGVNACCDVVNRGVAVWDGKVFVGTIDGRLIALDSATGDVIWDVNTIDRSKPYTITGAPRVVKGKVLIGNGGAEFGVRGYVSAYDADTGELAWRFYTVPGNPADGFEDPVLEMAAETWSGEWWTLGGGGTVWDSMAYDPDLDLLYIGVGNGTPWNHTLRSDGVGDNLFLASIVALDPDDGSYVWHYQSSPGETWDHTATQQITIADLVIDGERRRVLMQVPKNGFFYVLDAADGALISAKNVTEIAWATHVDLETGRPAETPEARYDVTGEPFLSTHNPNGVHTWHSMSYSPQTGLVYVPIHGSPFVFGAPAEFEPRVMTTNLGTDFSGNAALDPTEVYEQTYGRLIAWDPVAQAEVWRVERAGPANGGALSTAGGLVFQGTGSGQLTALDARTGAELWSSDVHTGVIAAPISYAIDGVQHVAIVVGTGGSWGAVGGSTNMKGYALPNVSRLLVYRLGGAVALPPAPPMVRPPLAPPPATASEQTVAAGAPLYATYCGSCHGAGAIGLGILPDLRRSPYLSDAEAWNGVVLGGTLAANGMASFAPVLDTDDALAIRAFVIARANQDAAAAAEDSADPVGGPPGALLAVVSKGLPGVTLYDAATDRPLCQAEMDVAPHEAAFSADGRMLYVPIYSSANIGQPGPDGHTINFMRTADCEIEHTLDTGSYKRPHYVERGPRSGLLYVTAEMDEAILVVDPERREIVDTLPTGSDKSHFFAMTADERLLFTSNVSDNTLSVIDIPGRRLVATIDAGASNQRMTVSPDGRWFVTSLWQSGKIAFYRTSDFALDFELPVDGAPFVARFSPDGSHLYNMGMPPPGGGPGGIRVWKIDTATREVVATSNEAFGTGTGGIQFNPVNGQLYLTAYSGEVSVLDPETLKLLRQFTAPDTPDGLFFSADPPAADQPRSGANTER